MNYIILDTNIFIHFKKFTEINWNKIVGNEDECLIVILPMVIDELDKHKYHKDQKISRRVRNILPEIEKLHNSDSTKIKLILKRPSNNTFQENLLDKTDNDDNIIASILEFKSKLKESDNLVFITNDTGPRLKSESLNIPCIKMDKEYLLSMEPSKSEKENQSLKNELEKYKNRLPKILFSFTDGQKYLVIEKKKPVSKEQFISSQMENIKKRYEEIKDENKTQEINNIYDLAKTLSGSFELSKEQVNNYNEKLKSFFQNYEMYLSSLYSHLKYLNNCIKVDFKIRNSGTAPGEDIDIDLHFPNGFKLHTSKGLPKVKEKPTPPYKPKNRFDFGPDFGFSLPSISPNYRPSVSSPDLNSPTIEETNSYNVNFHLIKLKHNQNFELETLYLKFDDLDSAKNFPVEYNITVGNLPDPIKGQLNVKIK